jgi:hypothetical protein
MYECDDDHQVRRDPSGQADDHTDGRGDRLVLRLTSSADVVAAVPYLLGFHPENSLVAIGTNGPQGSCAARLDLSPVEYVTDAAEHLAAVLSGNRFGKAVLVGYGTSEQVVPIVSAALTDRDIEVLEALRVEGGRFWHVACENPMCCPPEGIPYDITTSTIAAQATAAGHVALAGRGEVAGMVAPVDGTARASMRAATEAAQRRLLAWKRECGDNDSLHRRIIDEGVPYVQAIIQHGRPLDDDEVAWLGVLLTVLRIRDEAWVRTDENHLDLWRDVLRRVEPFYVAAPACLTAYAAYLAGNGALANVALDRAFTADPDYTMAQLLADLMLAGVPPSQARLAMTPQDLAAAYEKQTRPGDDSGPPGGGRS